MDSERGQATVELVAAVPAAAAGGGSVALQLLAAGYALTLADGAAEAGALALAAGQPAKAAAEDALPGWAEDDVDVAVRGGEVTVRLRPPSLLPAIADRLAVTSRELREAARRDERPRGPGGRRGRRRADRGPLPRRSPAPARSRSGPGLLIDVGGRPPRPTLLASAGARELEERLAVHLPRLRAASRGQICRLALDRRPARRREPARGAADGSRLDRGRACAARASQGRSRCPGSRGDRGADSRRPRLRSRPRGTCRQGSRRPWPARQSPQAPARLGSHPPSPVRRPASGCSRGTARVALEFPDAAPNSSGARVLR